MGDAGLEAFNAMAGDRARAWLLAACGSRAWAARVEAARPFAGRDALFDTADRVWPALAPADWREAFAAHPRIGERTADRTAAREQAGTQDASPAVLAALADANRDYEARFGHIFIVCATGRSAAAMLDMLRARMANDPQTELHVAAEEQRKITRLRLERALGARR